VRDRQARESWTRVAVAVVLVGCRFQWSALIEMWVGRTALSLDVPEPMRKTICRLGCQKSREDNLFGCVASFRRNSAPNICGHELVSNAEPAGPLVVTCTVLAVVKQALRSFGCVCPFFERPLCPSAHDRRDEANTIMVTPR